MSPRAAAAEITPLLYHPFCPQRTPDPSVIGHAILGVFALRLVRSGKQFLCTGLVTKVLYTILGDF